MLAQMSHAGGGPPADLIRRVRGEYLEMPGLSLTLSQAQRLWGLDPTLCGAVLDALVATRFLTRTHRGHYVRTDSGAVGDVPPQMLRGQALRQVRRQDSA